MKKINWKYASPVLMSFIVMGFVDIVGVSAGFVKKDFELSDKLAQLIPTMAFLWFFLLSIPTGILQDRIGKKKVLNLGMGLTGLGMLVPFVNYSFPSMLVAFTLLGVGNTIVQVAANPLLRDVVPHEKFSSFMSLSQFIKAIISLLGPILTTFFASYFGNWKLVFALYALTSFLSVLWLYLTKVEESVQEGKRASFKTCLKLLGNPYVLMMVMAIFLIVGADVGINSNIAGFFQAKFEMELNEASLLISVYFAAVMTGRFLGALMLNWIKPKKFLFWTSLATLIFVIALILSPGRWLAGVFVFLTGIAGANFFPLIFSISLNKMPDRANEISGLMIMAVSGGAIIPPLIGVLKTNYGEIAGMAVLALCMLYILFTAVYNIRKQKH